MSRATADATVLLLLLFLGLTLALQGCGASHPGDPAGSRDGGPADGGIASDAGQPPTDGGGSEACAPMQAEGEGPCDQFFGWAWYGSCVGVSGCGCIGADCGALFDDEADCETAFAECPLPTACGGFGGIACADDEWCDYPDGLCGAADGAGFCRPLPDACPGVVDPVCGCDGETHSNECAANQAGFDVRSPRGPC